VDQRVGQLLRGEPGDPDLLAQEAEDGLPVVGERAPGSLTALPGPGHSARSSHHSAGCPHRRPSPAPRRSRAAGRTPGTSWLSGIDASRTLQASRSPARKIEISAQFQFPGPAIQRGHSPALSITTGSCPTAPPPGRRPPCGRHDGRGRQRATAIQEDPVGGHVRMSRQSGQRTDVSASQKCPSVVIGSRQLRRQDGGHHERAGVFR
jgi:hypothetical protein